MAQGCKLLEAATRDRVDEIMITFRDQPDLDGPGDVLVTHRINVGVDTRAKRKAQAGL